MGVLSLDVLHVLEGMSDKQRLRHLILLLKILKLKQVLHMLDLMPLSIHLVATIHQHPLIVNHQIVFQLNNASYRSRQYLWPMPFLIGKMFAQLVRYLRLKSCVRCDLLEILEPMCQLRFLCAVDCAHLTSDLQNLKFAWPPLEAATNE